MVSKTIDRGSIPFFPVFVKKKNLQEKCSVSSLSGRASGLGPEGYEFKSHLTEFLVFLYLIKSIKNVFIFSVFIFI